MTQPHRRQSVLPDEATLPARSAWRRLPWVGLVAGVVGLGASLGFARGAMDQFYFSWLTAFMFFLSIALGGLFFVLAHYATKAGWSVVVRRIAEHAMYALPLFAVLFVPIWLGMHDLFEWTHEDVVARDHLLQLKSGYLNTAFFLVRALVYFVFWTALAVWFSSRSRRQDQSGEHTLTRRMQAVCAPGLVVFAVTTTFAAVDWMMSLDPHWYSTIFGVYYFSGCVIAIYAFMIVVFVLMQRSGLLRNVVTAEHFHDLGKMLFAFTVFWTYIAFSQFFLIWYGNIPEETLWYIHRMEGSWMAVTRLLAVGHFVVPFFFLMSHKIKRNTPLLLIGAVWMLAMHYLDMYWLIMPNLHHEGAHFGAVDVGALLAVGGFFLAVFGWALGRAALVPVRDPRLPESLGFENV